MGLAVIRAKAAQSGRRIGVLFANPGGPGGSGVDFIAKGVNAPGFIRLRERFDIVSFDVRASDRSQPVRCELPAVADPQTVPAAQLPQLFDSFSRDVVATCLRQNGSFINTLTSNNIARDIDVLRRALHERQISYVGLFALLDRRLTRGLESDIALADTLDAKLHAFAAWLEARATAQRRLTTAALRAGRAAMRVRAEPKLPIETLADEQHVLRRQLERDFSQWMGTSPRHLAQVARVQAVSRKAQTGASLADIAADVGFADQAHMSRVVHQLTGLTPRRFIRSGVAPMSAAFRRATDGGTVYL